MSERSTVELVAGSAGRADAVVLGVDIGTTNSKGVACLGDGTVVARAMRSHDVSRPAPGQVEHDAEGVWWGDTVALCRELTNAVGAPERIRAIAVTTCGPCLVPVDGAGDPLRPGILYGVDTRAGEEIRLLEEEIGAGVIQRMSRMPLTSQSVGPKLAWVARHEPEVVRRTTAWHTATSFIVARLSGVAVIDHHQASYFAPFIDAHRRVWDTRHAAGAGLPGLAATLPTLGWPGDVAGTVTSAAARVTGLREGVPVLVGTSDGPMEALAMGAAQPGIVAITHGSTTTLTAFARPARQPGGLWVTEGLSPDRPCVGGGLTTTGTLMTWLAELLVPELDAVTAAAVLEHEATASPPGARDVIVLPAFAGTSVPVQDSGARGVIAGLTLTHGRSDIARAVLEGIAFGVRHLIEAAEQAGIEVVHLRASGGGTANELALQIVSDVLGREQAVAVPPAGAAKGAARLAAEAVGITEPSADWFVPDRRIEPDLRNRAVYDDAYRGYLRLAEASGWRRWDAPGAPAGAAS